MMFLSVDSYFSLRFFCLPRVRTLAIDPFCKYNTRFPREEEKIAMPRDMMVKKKGLRSSALYTANRILPSDWWRTELGNVLCHSRSTVTAVHDETEGFRCCSAFHCATLLDSRTAGFGSRCTALRVLTSSLVHRSRVVIGRCFDDWSRPLLVSCSGASSFPCPLPRPVRFPQI